VIGNIYAFIAVGPALIFGVDNLINCAHGSVFMVSAYVGWVCVTWWNLPLMGAFQHSDRRQIGEGYERMLTLFPCLKERLHQRGGTLSGGEQQMLAIGRALIGRPRLICMDGPTMGLSPLYVDRVLALLQQINAQGYTIFMVEQNANLALQIAHRGYVLQNGRIVLEGNAQALLDNPEIQDAYLGDGLS
jgi:branched-chain amino acid transport system ATP-binding protein